MLVAAAGLACIAIRIAPEAWLRGRAPPGPLARALPWVPVVVSGALVGVLHLGDPAVRAEYAMAAVPAAATLLWRRSFYLPLLAGAVTLAALRAWGSF